MWGLKRQAKPGFRNVSVIQRCRAKRGQFFAYVNRVYFGKQIIYFPEVEII